MTSSLPLQVSFFHNLEDKHPCLKILSLERACNYFTPPLTPVFTKEERQAKAGRFSFNIYKTGTTRRKENVEFMTGIVLDFDNNSDGFVPIENVLDKLNEYQLLYFWYTTWSHTEELPRWRLIVPFLKPIPVAKWQPVYDKMILFLNSPPGIDHQASKDVSRIWCAPCQKEGHLFKSSALRQGMFLVADQIDRFLTSEQKARYEKQQQPKRQQNVVPLQDYSRVEADEVRDMLDYLDENCDYATWIKIGMALHNHFGGTTTGLDLWVNWSSPSPKFEGYNNLLCHWRSFSMQPGGVSIATLVRYAMDKGYKRASAPMSYSPSLVQERTIVSPPPEEEEKVEEDDGEEDEDNLALLDFSDCIHKDVLDFPTSFLKETYNYLLGSASYINHFYALSATIVLGGFLLRKLVANKKRKESHTNFMTLGIGPSGTGKTQILHAVQQILAELEQEKYYTHSLGTIQGAIETMRQQGGCMFLIQDEASYAFKAMKNKNISIHEMNVERFKLDMFSMPPFCKAPATKSGDMTSIKNPFFCEISFSTPDLLQHLSPESYSKGLLPRYLAFRDLQAGELSNTNVDISIPPSLMSLLKEYNTESYALSPVVVFEYEADLLLKKLKERVDETRRAFRKQEDSRQEMFDALLGRISEHATKLSLLGAEKRDNDSYLITLKAAQWGIAVALHSFKTLVGMIEDGIYENQIEETRARILVAVKKVSQGEEVPKRKISRRITYLNSRQLNEHLFKLQEEGQIEIRMRGKTHMYIKSRKKKEKKPS